MHLLEGPYNDSFFLHHHFFITRFSCGVGGTGVDRQAGCCDSLAGVDEFVGRLQKILKGDAALRGLQETVEILEQTRMYLINDFTQRKTKLKGGGGFLVMLAAKGQSRGLYTLRCAEWSLGCVNPTALQAHATLFDVVRCFGCYDDVHLPARRHLHTIKLI